MKRICVCLLLVVGLFGISQAATYYVSTSGSDASGDGSASRPWRTIRYALTKVPANQGHTLKISSGTFVESDYLKVPVGVNIEGAGRDATILKVESRLHYPTSKYGDRSHFMMILDGGKQTTKQTIKGFGILGDGKKLYGGIVVYNRNNVLIENVKVEETYYCGVRLWNTTDTRMTNVHLKNVSWGSAAYAMGSIILGDVERIEIDNCSVDENFGYGMKLDAGPKCWNVKIHHNRFSVVPEGTWETNTGFAATNFAMELWGGDLRNVEIYDNYIDNVISLVMNDLTKRSGVQTVRVYNNVLDHTQRARGRGIGMELSLNDAEIDHNYFLGGTGGIANWGEGIKGTPTNWKIHHNVFYAISPRYPAPVIDATRGGLSDSHIYNNTVEFTGNGAMSFFGLNYGGVGRNIKIENNLIIDNYAKYEYGEKPQIIKLDGGARLQNVTLRNNYTNKVSWPNLSGITSSGNLTGNPQISQTGNRPDPYYRPKAGSPLIDKGVQIPGMSYSGSAPDIGAFEYGAAANPPANELPQGSISSPANNSVFGEGVTIEIKANAADKDGSVAKVEFYDGNTKLGEDTSSPYSYEWKNASAGTHRLTIKVTDDKGATFTSPATTITVVAAANKKPAVNITGPANNSSFETGERITIRANASDEDGSVVRVEFYRGSTKLGEDATSPYEYAWTNAEPGNYNITAKATDDKGESTTSSAIAITVNSPTNEAPTIALSSPANNSTHTEGNPITLRATASDKDGAIKKVEFFQGTNKLGEDTTEPYSLAWTNARVGTHTITARATDDKDAVAVSAPLSVHVKAPDNQAPVVQLTGPSNNSTLNAGNITLTATASDPDGAITKVEFYNGSTKLGEDLSSPYTFTWSGVGAGTYTLTARATDNKSAVTTSAAITVKVVQPNKAPSIAITSPSNNATFAQGASVTIRVDASDSDGAISKVEFFNGNSKLGEDLSSPYSFTWTNVPAGNHTITAKATDNQSATATSQAVAISVSVANKAPIVQLTSPAQNARFDQGATITLSASASDSDGSVTKVEFFNGNTKLGEDTSSPYSFSWTNAPAGNHTITAKATDNKSATATSQAVSITVTAANKLPVVQLTSPAQNAKFDQGATVTLTATASDSDGSITKVEFYNGNTRLGQDTSSPYSFAWTNVPAGTHKLTAKATDNRSGVTTSSAVTITVVVPNKAPVVKITKPANNTVFDEGQPISIEATATDSDGTIAKVEFFNGAVRLGEDTSSPYTLDWPNALPGKYTLSARATDNKGATATASVNIEVKEQVFVPVARAGNDVAIELPENSVTLKGDGESDNGDIVQYDWVQLDGPQGATIEIGPDGEAVVTNLTEGTYRFQLTVTDKKNQKATDIITVRVYPLPIASVELPRIFSPNGDGINDYWEWSNPELFQGSRLVIFNRAGQKIYEVTSYDNTWDGTVNGKPLQEDAYYYVIKSNQGELTGAVRIVR